MRNKSRQKRRVFLRRTIATNHAERRHKSPSRLAEETLKLKNAPAMTYRRAVYFSIPERSIVVVVDLTIAGAVRPIPIGRTVVFWSSFQLLLDDANPVTAEVGVVLKIRPRHRVI